MATNVLADPNTRIIEVQKAVTNGRTTLDVASEIYSELKNDWKNDPVLNRLHFPFRVSGGDAIDDTTKTGGYYFLRNDLGWRFKPSENDQELILNGNLFPADTQQPLFLSTDGNYTVALRLNTSQLTQQVTPDTGLIDINALATAAAQSVFDYDIDAHNTNNSAGNLFKRLLRFDEWLSIRSKG